MSSTVTAAEVSKKLGAAASFEPLDGELDAKHAAD